MDVDINYFCMKGLVCLFEAIAPLLAGSCWYVSKLSHFFSESPQIMCVVVYVCVRLLVGFFHRAGRKKVVSS